MQSCETIKTYYQILTAMIRGWERGIVYSETVWLTQAQIVEQFRQWENQVLKEYLLKGYSVNRRLAELEHTVAEHSRKIDFFVRTSLPPVEGIFYKGQMYITLESP